MLLDTIRRCEVRTKRAGKRLVFVAAFLGANDVLGEEPVLQRIPRRGGFARGLGTGAFLGVAAIGGELGSMYVLHVHRA